MPNIFICHASEDKPTAEPIQLALAGAGYDVFYDESSLPPGGDYHDRIHKAILRCDVFVFLISKESISHGKYTLAELKFAREKWPSPVGRVLPVVLQSVPTQDIPPYLAATTILTVHGNAAAEVRAAVAGLLTEQRRKRRKPVLVLSLFIAIGSVSLTIFVGRNSTSNTPSQPQPMTGQISLKSETGDYIGAGKEYTFDNRNGKLTASTTKNTISIHFDGDDSWSLEFAAPQGKSLEVGQYISAQRAAFHNPVKPGLDVSGAGRGCNELTGTFNIREVKFSTSDTLSRFAADFEQHCESAKPSLRGAIDLEASPN